MADSPLFEWKNNKVLVQPKNSKGNKTLKENLTFLKQLFTCIFYMFEVCSEPCVTVLTCP